MPSPVVLGEFAVNPACMCTSADLSLGLNVFGFEHGAVVSDFPNGWYKLVRARANQLPNPDRGIFMGKTGPLSRTSRCPSEVVRAR
jgi:hypothetical protein